MGMLYTRKDIARLFGLTITGVKYWDDMGYLPAPCIVGLRKKRVWNEGKLKVIIQWALDNGYVIKDPSILYPGVAFEEGRRI